MCYSLSIVVAVLSYADKSFIVIFTRDIDSIRINGDLHTALDFAADNGFINSPNSPLETFQSSTQCHYFKNGPFSTTDAALVENAAEADLAYSVPKRFSHLRTAQ